MNSDVISANKVQLQVPSSWQIRPLKSLASFRKGLNILKTDLSDQGVRVISYGQIHDKSNTGVKLADGLLRYIPQDLTRGGAGSRLRYGDLVFADTSEDLGGAGNAVFVDTDDEVFAGYHTVICRLHDENVLPKFLAYVVNSEWWRSQVRRHVSGVKVFSITRRVLSSTFVQFPAYPEQRRIVQLLDAETAKIDQAMSLLHRELETMEQLKKSLIYEVVTKGLDPTVPMKPSGVEWIGEIPEHWVTKRLRYVASAKTGQTPPSDDPTYFDGPVTWYTPNDVNNDHVDTSARTLTLKAISERRAPLISAGVTLFVGIGATIGKVGFSNSACSFNQQITALPTYVDSAEWLFYVMQAQRDFIVGQAMYTTLPIVNNGSLGDLLLPIPPGGEQSEIAVALNKRISHIDQIVAVKKLQSETLARQRESLIFEYVTGKRRVSEVA